MGASGEEDLRPERRFMQRQATINRYLLLLWSLGLDRNMVVGVVSQGHTDCPISTLLNSGVVSQGHLDCPISILLNSGVVSQGHTDCPISISLNSGVASQGHTDCPISILLNSGAVSKGHNDCSISVSLNSSCAFSLLCLVLSLSMRKIEQFMHSAHKKQSYVTLPKRKRFSCCPPFSGPGF